MSRKKHVKINMVPIIFDESRFKITINSINDFNRIILASMSDCQGVTL